MIKKIILKFRSLHIRIFTMLLKGKFRAWGQDSRLENPAKISGHSHIEVGKHVHICSNAWLNVKDDKGEGKPTLTIGDGTYIGRSVQINAWQNVVIEDHVLIADRVYISDADHIFEKSTKPIMLQGDEFRASVCLKKGCWVGIGAVIMPGVTIGKNAVVGANSVVYKDVPDFTVVAGVPAKVIRVLTIKK